MQKNDQNALNIAKQKEGNPNNSTGGTCIYDLSKLVNIINEENVKIGGKSVKKTPKNMKKTAKKVKVGNVERCVYKGPRGGEYIKMNGEFKPLKK